MSVAGLQLIAAAGQKSFPNKPNYGNFGRLMTAMRITSHSLPPFQNLLKDHHCTDPLEPSIMFTEESYHRLRRSSGSGTLLIAAPISMKNAARRRDARKPGRHTMGWWEGRKEWNDDRWEKGGREGEVLVLGMHNIYWANKLSVINYNLQYIFLKGSERRGEKRFKQQEVEVAVEAMEY